MRKPILEQKTFEHRGHRYEVSRNLKLIDQLSSTSYPVSGFCYYIFSADDETRSISETKRLFETTGDFHCGVTYCQKIINKSFDDNPENKSWMADQTFYKIGCDYNHYWDEAKVYDIDFVCMEAERTIDNLIDAGLLKNKEVKS